MDASLPDQMVIFGRKKPFLKLNWKSEGQLCDNGFVDILAI